MKELITGRIRAFIEDQDGKDREAPISPYVSPLIYLRSLQDFMLKDRELRLKQRSFREKRKGTGRGIQVVLLNGAGQPANRPSAAANRCPGTSDRK